MASGTFDRPLPDPADERALLGLSGLKAKTTEVSANQTATFAFPSSGTQDGLVILSAGNVGKRAMYIYGATTTGNVNLTEINAPTQSGLSVSASGRSIVVTNPSQAVFVCVLAFQGSLPTVTVA